MLINLLLYKILYIAFYAMTAYTRIESKMSHFSITHGSIITSLNNKKQYLKTEKCKIVLTSGEKKSVIMRFDIT